MHRGFAVARNSYAPCCTAHSSGSPQYRKRGRAGRGGGADGLPPAAGRDMSRGPVMRYRLLLLAKGNMHSIFPALDRFRGFVIEAAKSGRLVACNWKPRPMNKLSGPHRLATGNSIVTAGVETIADNADAVIRW